MIRLALAICFASIASLPSFSADLALDKYAGQPQSVTQVRIASCSVFPEKWNKASNWPRIEEAVRKAAGLGADVVVTPEGALEGYVINEVNDVKEPAARRAIVKRFLDLGEPIDGPYFKQAQALADELDIFFVLGFLERRGDSLFNTAALIDPDGDIVGKYSKTHFAQGYTINPTCYVAGEEYPVFDTPFGKVGMIICYDRQLPEPTRILALKGAQLLLLPSYGGYDDGSGWNTMMVRTRARENRFPLVFSHPNQSLMIDGRGDLHALCGTNEIAIYTVDTSPERYEGRFRNRRPETYAPLTEPSLKSD